MATTKYRLNVLVFSNLQSDDKVLLSCHTKCIAQAICSYILPKIRPQIQAKSFGMLIPKQKCNKSLFKRTEHSEVIDEVPADGVGGTVWNKMVAKILVSSLVLDGDNTKIVIEDE